MPRVPDVGNRVMDQSQETARIAAQISRLFGDNPLLKRSETHCRNGHAWADVRIIRDPKGYTICGECMKASGRKHRLLKAR